MRRRRMRERSIKAWTIIDSRGRVVETLSYLPMAWRYKWCAESRKTHMIQDGYTVVRCTITYEHPEKP